MLSDLNVVLVHGAWAEGSCWSNVIPLLQNEGYKRNSHHNQDKRTSINGIVVRLKIVLANIQAAAVLTSKS